MVAPFLYPKPSIKSNRTIVSCTKCDICKNSLITLVNKKFFVLCWFPIEVILVKWSMLNLKIAVILLHRVNFSAFKILFFAQIL